MEDLQIDATDVIEEYRAKTSKLDFDNTVLRLQIKKLQSKIDELTAEQKNDVKEENK